MKLILFSSRRFSRPVTCASAVLFCALKVPGALTRAPIPRLPPPRFPPLPSPPAPAAPAPATVGVPWSNKSVTLSSSNSNQQRCTITLTKCRRRQSQQQTDQPRQPRSTTTTKHNLQGMEIPYGAQSSVEIRERIIQKRPTHESKTHHQEHNMRSN